MIYHLSEASIEEQNENEKNDKLQFFNEMLKNDLLSLSIFLI